MVLRNSGRVGSRHFEEAPVVEILQGFSVYIDNWSLMWHIVSKIDTDLTFYD